MDKTLNKFVADYLWSEKVVHYSPWRQKLIGALRLLYVVIDN